MSGTALFMLIAFVSLVIIDIWLATDHKIGNTYSERIREWDKRFPVVRMLICFAFGLCAGHWWW
jgi:hypothetical protein